MAPLGASWRYSRRSGAVPARRVVFGRSGGRLAPSLAAPLSLGEPHKDWTPHDHSVVSEVSELEPIRWKHLAAMWHMASRNSF